MRTSWLSTTPSVVIVIFAIVTITSCQVHDETITPGAKGSAVVEATLDRLSMQCVFVDDKLLMRRIAYVESADGANPDTFRDGYYGGIWQVDKAMFDVTKSSSVSVALSQFISQIRTALAIDWSRVVWQDLLKPLYSALGAQIYIQYTSLNDVKGIPRDIPAQAEFWKRYYRPNGDVKRYTEASLRLEDGCQNNVGADIVFVLDGSGSIGSANFETIRKFVKDVIRSFDVAPDRNRFAVILFSTYVSRQFNLNTYSNMNDVLKAVDRIVYPGGGTNTHLALDEMRTQSFAERNGARPRSEGHPRVGIILTDGESNNRPLTIDAALKVHVDDITAFAIGVGSGIYVPELDVIASDPDCMHRFILRDFSEVDSLKYAIERRTCEAPITISPSQNSTGGRLPPGSEQNCKIKVPKEGATLQMLANGGSATFYTSQSTYPSPEYYDQKVVSLPGSPGIIFVPKPATSNVEGIVFCSIKGDNVTETNVSIGLNPGDTTECRSSPCRNNASCTNLIKDYRCECLPGWMGKNCETEIDECVSNPCVHGDCIDQWIGYVCRCPPGFTGVHCETEIDECVSNPCVHGDCIDQLIGYECRCPPGFTGVHCETDINECVSNPCVHGDCIDQLIGYECRCPPGFTGVHCETDIDECASRPCIDGNCVDQTNGYFCSCKSGYTGTNCEIDIDDCASRPCIAGQCTDKSNRYICTCNPGYTGTNCESDIDECKSYPCLNGECRDKVNGYVCDCKSGWQGTNCDEIRPA